MLQPLPRATGKPLQELAPGWLPADLRFTLWCHQHMPFLLRAIAYACQTAPALPIAVSPFNGGGLLQNRARHV